MGERESYLWAVTSRTLSLHRLPPAAQIRHDVGSFRGAVRSEAVWREPPNQAPTSRTLVGRGLREESQLEHIGERLYVELFGALSRGEANKREWLLSLDDALFDRPFAALLKKRKDGKVTYLIEEHSVQASWSDVLSASPGFADARPQPVVSGSRRPNLQHGRLPVGRNGPAIRLSRLVRPRRNRCESVDDWRITGRAIEPAGGKRSRSGIERAKLDRRVRNGALVRLVFCFVFRGAMRIVVGRRARSEMIFSR
jgi:hypothetical protein